MSEPILASYANPEYIKAVEVGLRVTGTFDAVDTLVNSDGQLIFVDAEGNRFIFEAFGSSRKAIVTTLTGDDLQVIEDAYRALCRLALAEPDCLALYAIQRLRQRLNVELQRLA